MWQITMAYSFPIVINSTNQNKILIPQTRIKYKRKHINEKIYTIKVATAVWEETS